jgi:hypothetical protein
MRCHFESEREVAGKSDLTPTGSFHCELDVTGEMFARLCCMRMQSSFCRSGVTNRLIVKSLRQITDA